MRRGGILSLYTVIPHAIYGLLITFAVSDRNAVCQLLRKPRTSHTIRPIENKPKVVALSDLWPWLQAAQGSPRSASLWREIEDEQGCHAEL